MRAIVEIMTMKGIKKSEEVMMMLFQNGLELKLIYFLIISAVLFGIGYVWSFDKKASYPCTSFC